MTQPADTAAPQLTAAPKAPKKIAALVKSGIPVTVKCSEACKVTVLATVDKATAKRLKLGKSLQVGKTTRNLAAGAKASLKLKLSAKAAKAAKRQRSIKVKLTITAVDAAGNAKVSKKTVTVRR